MKIVERNVYCGNVEPKPLVETAYSKILNEGIWSKTVTNEDGSKSTIWYVSQCTKEIYEDRIKEITDEHDELIAEILEDN